MISADSPSPEKTTGTPHASGGNVFDQSGVRGEAFYVKAFLSELGVPAEVVLTEERSRNTYQNAVETSRILAREGWHSILLVTSD